jgi:alpha-ketoglutarate-dependent sulfate ester dioxygenase
MGAILHAVSVPEIGGDTLFSDMYAAYAALDEPTRDLVEDLTAVHNSVRAFDRSAPSEHPSVRHPVVCTHAATGRRHLYVNRGFVESIEGMAPVAGHDLLDRLCRQADYPEHQVRLHWKPHTVAFWDNRAVQHYAASDYWPQVRIMERVSIVGPRPAR